MIYKETFNFTIKIYDASDNTSIEDLFWNQTSLGISNTLNLNILNNTIDNKTFRFSILANNVGNTTLVFEFTKAGANKQFVIVDLSIRKKEGELIMVDSTSSAIYSQNIAVNITLNGDFGLGQNITQLYVNGTLTSFASLGNYVYQFTFSTYDTIGRGNYILDIRAESSYFFGITNSSNSLVFEVLPIPLILQIFVSNYNITEDSNVVIFGLLTLTDGTPLDDFDITFYIYIYFKDGAKAVFAFTGYNEVEILTGNTNSTGHATVNYLITEAIEYVSISASFEGNAFYSEISFDLEEIVRSVKPPGLPPGLLYGIIAAAIVLLAIVSFLVYRFTRTKPLEQLMKEIEDEEVFAKLVEINPGVFLNIFDQTKGAIPLVTDHNLDGIYLRRLAIGIDNFLLKIADQAYSSLGFEDHHDKRRIGSILLPKEGMVGLIHGIQLPNVASRGGFENLTLIVLVNEEHDNAFLGNQAFLFEEIDELIILLKDRKPLESIRDQLRVIRRKATRIVLASLQVEPLDIESEM
jgi:hypothetical protein